MGVEFVGAELAETVPGEPRGVIHEQAYRGERVGGSKYPDRAVALGEIRHDPGCTFGNSILLMVDMGEHSPAIGDKSGGDRRADALAGPGDDCGSLGSHRWRSCLEWRGEAIQGGADARKPRTNRAAVAEPCRASEADRRAPPAAGRPMESRALRRFTHPYRARRHLVS